ncbi:unnamed protein product [Agarophyton chilense]
MSSRQSVAGRKIQSLSTHTKSLCTYFQNTGTCKFGNSCRFSHDIRNISKKTPHDHKSTQSSSRASSEASMDVTQFMQRITNMIKSPNASLRLNHPHELDLWKQSWSAVGVGAELSNGSALLSMLMRLPPTSLYLPPTQDVLRTLARICQHVSRNNLTERRLLKTFELIADVFEHRLLGREGLMSISAKQSCIDKTAELRADIHTGLMKVIGNPKTAHRASKLLIRSLTVFDRYISDLQRQEEVKEDENLASDETEPWAGWRDATVGWLQRGSWLNNVTQLHKEYDSVEQFADTMRGLMTTLAFFWGAGAMFPKCRLRKDAAKSCDQPLHVQICSGRKTICGQKLANRQTCTEVATWRCVRHGHDQICDRCLRKTQEFLVGEPGPRASTDIYDAVVERETTRRDGIVYIASKLESRKPPSVTPNWKTTYRLNCSALVGIVRLGASYEPLSPHSRIEWAEIVPSNSHGPPTLDFHERARGRIALRLLTRADLSTLNGSWEALKPGSRIAIIDLQVFVPEVISVLSSLTDPGLVEHLRHIQFWPQLIGTNRAGENRNSGSNVSEVVKYALEDTQLDSVSRLEPWLKTKLCEKITRLALQTNLDGTQLEAFAAALSNSLHCTQGPPGTGKSYLGVVLIKALDFIRSAARQSGNPVGPIVVLSYKNHALDEILGDVIDSQEWHGKIIRCGKTDDPRLSSCMERHSKEERYAQTVLTERVSCMRRTRRIMRDLRGLSSAFADETGASLHSWTSNWKSDERDKSDTALRWVLQMLRFHEMMQELNEEVSGEEAYGLLVRTMVQEVEMGVPSKFDSSLLKVLPKLRDDTQHWFRGQINPTYFLLSKWLAGSHPPPRCAEDGCLFVSERPGAFCKEEHACLKRGCDKRRASETTFCGDHRCRYKGLICEMESMDGASICVHHACIYCLKQGIIPVQPKIRAACKDHSCQDEDCPRAFLAPNLPFCEEHCCHLCHHFSRLNPDNVKSVHRVAVSRYCAEHKCSVHGCNANRDQEGFHLYCKYHGCVACVGNRQVVDPVMEASRLCVDHRCASILYEKLCASQREENSLFCPAHTCRFCREEGLSLNRAVVDREPRNACSHHPLCENLSESGKICNTIVSSLHTKYCEKHLKRNTTVAKDEVVLGKKKQCEGTNRKGKRCNVSGVSEKAFYCSAHLNQKLESESDSDSETEFEGYNSDEQEQVLAVGSAKEKEADTGVMGGRLEDISSGSRPQEPNEVTMADIIPSHFPEQSALMTSPDQLNYKLDKSEADNCVNFRCPDGDKSLNNVQGDNPKVSGHRNAEEKTLGVDGTEKIVSENEPGHKSSSPKSFMLHGDSDDVSVDLLRLGTVTEELCVSSSDSGISEEEIPDQMRHLQDIVDMQSASGSDSDEEVSVVSFLPEARDDENISSSPEDWHWSQLLSERRRLVSSFLRGILSHISKIAEVADTHVECSRRELSEAAAYSFKSANVIGATVIGATRRLHALRASEPFAMIVEEACEVLEPTLVSVLSVRSLRKLELIGDHRQLPAYVQPCWFSIQAAIPSIKISLFERLVLNDPSACTVLNVQRRMRPFICDLTRCEYEDLVEIEDYEGTKSQLIGDKLKVSSFVRRRAAWQAEERDVWVGEGSLVPGVIPQVFFWDLRTEEGRAAVGLSRCNYGEAEASVALARWLVYCGVPPGSITIITPYKGQKLTITEHLRGKSDERLKDIFVSTVDRYQGDENDIVILSLVSTRPGNQFVALRNRFIVSLSRARIGMYVIGSSEAVSKNAKGREGPTHWSRLLKNLRERAESNRGLLNVNPLESIGPVLSICCPRHAEVSRDIKSAVDFPVETEDLKNFCTNTCGFTLSWCGHACGLQCHSPKTIMHRNKCLAVLSRSCETHINVPLLCHEVRENAKGSKDLDSGLVAYQCDVPIVFCRPECSHSLELECHTHQKVEVGTVKLPNCSERVGDYVNPSCGHKQKNPTCYNRRKYEEKTPACRELVLHDRPCGCKTRMTCQDSVKELSLDQPPICLEAVAKPRPRCSHILSSRCHEATTFQELWSAQDGEGLSESSPIVLHGEHYGPSETEMGRSLDMRSERQFPLCLVKTAYRRSCGHVMMVRCDDAFQLASGFIEEGLCLEEVPQISPLCGHEIKTACHFTPLIESQPRTLFVTRTDETGDVETIADETALEDFAQQLNPRVKKLGGLCGSSFVIQRKCGHKSNILQCTELYSLFRKKLLPPCKANVKLRMSCGHSYTAKCHLQNEPYPECKEPVEDVFVYPSCKRLHTVRPGVCSELQRLRALENPQCPIIVQCTRSRCAHDVDLPCHMENLATIRLPGSRIDETDSVIRAGVDYCEAAVGVKPCNEPVTYRRLCGHEEVNIQCSRAFEWARDPHSAPPCHVWVEAVSPLCQHAVNIECGQSEAIDSLIPWDDSPPSRINMVFDGHKELTSPVVVEGRHEPKRFFDIRLPACVFTTRLQRKCGHEEDVKCTDIFVALESSCEQSELVTCEEYGHETSVPCHRIGNESNPYVCQTLVEKKCSTCSINFTKVECFKKIANCARDVSGTLPCGHPVTWTCGEEDPLQGFKIESCLICVRESFIEALKETRLMIGDQRSSESDESKNDESPNGSRWFDSGLLLKTLINRAQSSLPQSCIVQSEELGPIDEISLKAARLRVLECLCDILTEAMNSGEISTEELDLHRPPKLSDALNSYDIVYMILSKDESPIDCFRMRDCQYGFGASTSILCEEAVAADYLKCEEYDGISVGVAAVLKLRGMKNVHPFRPPRDELERESKSNGSYSGNSKGRGLQKKNPLKKARRKTALMVEGGYDHAQPVSNLNSRVYWISEAILPILKLKIQPMRTCEICFDDMLPVKGWCCAEDHFLCRGCFNRHVGAARAPDAGARYSDDKGNLLCPHDGCSSRFDDLHLIGQKHDASDEEVREVMTSLEKLRTERHTNREVQSALHQQKAQLQAEFLRIQTIQDKTEKDAQILKLNITRDILTLRCPEEGCRVAFVDFSGCFALQCGNKECRIDFCAWCLKSYSTSEVHGHVVNCPERATSQVYNSLAVFNEHHQKRRKNIIEEKLSKEDKAVRKRTLELLKRELEDLGIEIGM